VVGGLWGYREAMTTTATGYQYLAPNPGSAYRQMFIKGTRIRARVLYGLVANTEEPMSPEAVAAEYGLPVAAVQEAVAYCRSNPPELEEDYRQEEASMAARGLTVARARKENGPG